MGIVYLAKDPLIGRLVALKTIRPVAHADDDETKEFQQRFIREAQAAGILNHPAIVTVHDIGQDEASGMSFIAMEYVEGSNLKEMLSQGRTMTYEQIGDIVAQIADALDFAHSKGIVHRDVKPANIILLEGYRAKITDFGIAKIASGVANLTTTGQFLGTPNYMAPEQIKGAPVDGRTDIFSLGICLYECLTRRKPFGGDSLTSISYKIVHESFPALHEINPQIPEAFEEVVAQCLAKDPSKRYQRGKELAAALRAVMRGERPAPRVETFLADETVVTRAEAHDRLPTVEIPFPQADELPRDAGVSTTRVSQKTPQPAAGVPLAARRGEGPAVRPPSRVRNTLTNVRALPVWRQRIHPAVFLGIIAVLVAGLLGAVVIIQARQPKVPPVNKQEEARRAKERQLRMEGNELLRQGRVTDAAVKFDELKKLAPASPAVTTMVERLSAMRQREEVNKLQLAQAQQKFDEAMALYNARKFEESIPVFEAAFQLNPNNQEASTYLQLAKTEQEKVDQARAKTRQQQVALRQQTATTTQAVHPGGTGGDGGHQPPVPVTPAKLTTIVNSPIADGYVQVKVGGTVIVHENLFEERRGLFRRNAPRLVNVTREVTPADTEIDIWLVVPSQKINDHRVVRQNLRPGGEHKLYVRYDPKTRQVDVRFE
jgi:tetratricopeptide (TPR) repeat protein